MKAHSLSLFSRSKFKTLFDQSLRSVLNNFEMDEGRRRTKLLGNRNNKIYMDLKDIIREHTLPFLPAKSLCRFTSVCRDWKLMISSPFFAHNQANAFRTISGLFVQTLDWQPSFISLDPKSCGVPDPSLKFLPELVDIKSSSNGLLCCHGLTGDKPYYICNPVTKQWKKLPKPNADHGQDPAVVLISEPSRLNFVAEYKLVCIFSSPDADFGNEFEIYSSAQGSWRISGEICYGQRGIKPRSGVYVDGVVYWQGSRNLLAFDITMERSQLIPSSSGTLGVVDGKLCAASMSGNYVNIRTLNNAHTNTMQMHSQVQTWKANSHPLTFTVTQGSGERTAVLYAGDDYLAVRADKSVLSYNLKTKETRTVGEVYDQKTRGIGYVNSLIEL